jgi:hypothetical protein
MTYNLWDTVSGNLIISFLSERDALEFVRNEVAAGGTEAIEDWALLSQDEQRRSQPIAVGSALIMHAQAVVA